MTNLTEQWNKNKLKDGFYYVAIDEPFMPKKVEIIEFYKTGFETDMDSNYMHEVLAEVPSYEETIAMKDCSRMLWAAAEREVKLKKLLKECCYRIDWTAKTGHKPTDDAKQKLFNDIDQVLKENNNA